MKYYLELFDNDGWDENDTTGRNALPAITLDFDDNQASRGAVMAGLNKATNITFTAYDIDEKGKRWDKEI